MRNLLKEALMCVCGENRWSYAVFWKFGCQNPTLLIWEDHHYQPTKKSVLSHISGIDSTDLLLKEWEGLWSSGESRFSQLGYNVEDRICSLINKMMINSHVHVVGEGLVGRAAFTGNHQWILPENCMGKDHPSKVLSEVQLQFSAGMQTVTAIPVLPHGVVQLGSTLAIAENLGFVNDVKNLFAQLGGATAALLSDFITEKDTDLQNVGASPSLGKTIHAGSARNSYQVARFTTFSIDSCNQEVSTSPAPGRVSQLAPSVTQTQNCMPCNAAVSRTPDLSSITAPSVCSLTQIKSHSAIKPYLPLRGQLEAGAVGAQVILSSPDIQLNQRTSPHNSNSRFSDQRVQSVLASTNVKMQQTKACAGLQQHVNCILPSSNKINTSQLRTCGATHSNTFKDSVIVSLLGGSQPPDSGNGFQKLTSATCSRPIPRGSVESDSAHLPLKGLQPNSCDTGANHMSNYGSLSTNNSVLLGVPERSCISTNDDLTRITSTEGKLVIDNDLFQALNIPSAHTDDHIARCGPISGFPHDYCVSSLKRGNESQRPQNVICEDECEQLPSGDDLFDILGLDFKNKPLYGIWNGLLVQSPDVNISNSSKDASTCTPQKATGHYSNGVDDGLSESGIFNETGLDHLLDAVVSKVHSSAKENLDDDMSCWSLLTKSTSSAPVSGQVNVPDHKQVKLGFPRAKSQITASGFLKSECSKDTVGEASQVNSMYGSQISLLGEDGQSMKRDNSISTAHSKKPDETGKANRKRLRPGENPRPRPKDRQMIQDRVKELREIVPNGAKCSIDALLERTIKHMQFLQSVAKHAEKLKHTGESKIISKDGGLFLKDNFEGGATWAFEVGTQSMVCPIIVEDLNSPRQMLVEMLCEDHGFFLEIADIIRGLGLTILKGVMEARNDKVWVRFTVEANRDVTRMEIFLSLVHLLEQVMKSSEAASKGNLMVHQASIPVIGESSSLQ